MWRFLSAGLALPVLLVVVLLDSVWLAGALSVVTVLGVFEYYRLFRSSSIRHLLGPGLVWAVLLIANVYLIVSRRIESIWTIPLVLGGLLLFFGVYVSITKSSRSIEGGVFAVLGPLYLGLTLSHALLLRELEQGSQWLILALACTFSTDSAAFFLGKAFGKHHMAPRISPGKTWEGAAAGLLAGVGVILLMDVLLGLPMSLWQAAILGTGASFAAQVGDLAESALKRYVGAKDAGRLIPGHGGILDRLDSIVLTLVLVYYGALWVVT